MKKNLFWKKEKDLTVSTHFTIRNSIVKKINEDSKKFNISKSKIVDTILAEYYGIK